MGSVPRRCDGDVVDGGFRNRPRCGSAPHPPGEGYKSHHCQRTQHPQLIVPARNPSGWNEATGLWN
jgi:hypothetical protein